MENQCIGFIGLGLIGGSIAKTIKKISPDTIIIAYNRTPSVLEAAQKDHIADIICNEVDDRFSQCDYIFLCLPVSLNAEFLKILKPIIKEHCIITDVGSVKTDIHAHASALDMDKNFIGGHPMTGSEKTGYQHSTDYLLENTYYIITPSVHSRQEDLEDYRTLVARLGAIPMLLDYKEHDYMTAAVSHLPHVIASSLVNLVRHADNEKETMKTIAAGGFRDVTRIAAGSPLMWQQICLTNSINICQVLDDYILQLQDARTLFAAKDADLILNFFEEAAHYRKMLPLNKGLTEPIYELYCDIHDETGAIAHLASSLAKHNISIKNIGIINNREFEHGALHIEFYKEEALRSAIELLQSEHYTIYHQ